MKLFTPAELPESYDPLRDLHVSNWEVLHHLIRALDSDGVVAAGQFLAQVGDRSDGGGENAIALSQLA